jgi:hypothetical protein
MTWIIANREEVEFRSPGRRQGLAQQWPIRPGWRSKVMQAGAAMIAA